VVGDTGFQLAGNPDTVRGPDVAFIRAERVPDAQTPGFPSLGPDLVIEVLLAQRPTR
jgi:Uma2 family endonuclease